MYARSRWQLACFLSHLALTTHQFHIFDYTLKKLLFSHGLNHAFLVCICQSSDRIVGFHSSRALVSALCQGAPPPRRRSGSATRVGPCCRSIRPGGQVGVTLYHHCWAITGACDKRRGHWAECSARPVHCEGCACGSKALPSKAERAAGLC